MAIEKEKNMTELKCGKNKTVRLDCEFYHIVHESLGYELKD